MSTLFLTPYTVINPVAVTAYEGDTIIFTGGINLIDNDAIGTINNPNDPCLSIPFNLTSWEEDLLEIRVTYIWEDNEGLELRKVVKDSYELEKLQLNRENIFTDSFSRIASLENNNKTYRYKVIVERRPKNTEYDIKYCNNFLQPEQNINGQIIIGGLKNTSEYSASPVSSSYASLTVSELPAANNTNTVATMYLGVNNGNIKIIDNTVDGVENTNIILLPATAGQQIFIRNFSPTINQTIDIYDHQNDDAFLTSMDYWAWFEFDGSGWGFVNEELKVNIITVSDFTLYNIYSENYKPVYIIQKDDIPDTEIIIRVPTLPTVGEIFYIDQYSSSPSSKATVTILDTSNNPICEFKDTAIIVYKDIGLWEVTLFSNDDQKIITKIQGTEIITIASETEEVSPVKVLPTKQYWGLGFILPEYTLPCLLNKYTNQPNIIWDRNLHGVLWDWGQIHSLFIQNLNQEELVPQQQELFTQNGPLLYVVTKALLHIEDQIEVNSELNKIILQRFDQEYDPDDPMQYRHLIGLTLGQLNNNILIPLKIRTVDFIYGVSVSFKYEINSLLLANSINIDYNRNLLIGVFNDPKFPTRKEAQDSFVPYFIHGLLQGLGIAQLGVALNADSVNLPLERIAVDSLNKITKDENCPSEPELPDIREQMAALMEKLLREEDWLEENANKYWDLGYTFKQSGGIDFAEAVTLIIIRNYMYSNGEYIKYYKKEIKKLLEYYNLRTIENPDDESCSCNNTMWLYTDVNFPKTVGLYRTIAGKNYLTGIPLEPYGNINNIVDSESITHFARYCRARCARVNFIFSYSGCGNFRGRYPGVKDIMNLRGQKYHSGMSELDLMFLLDLGGYNIRSKKPPHLKNAPIKLPRPTANWVTYDADPDIGDNSFWDIGGYPNDLFDQLDVIDIPTTEDRQWFPD